MTTKSNLEKQFYSLKGTFEFELEFTTDANQPLQIPDFQNTNKAFLPLRVLRF